MLRHFAALALAVGLSIGRADAQADTAATSRVLTGAVLPMAGPDQPTFAAVQRCPRFRCEVVVETGTVEGTRIRVGDTNKVIPLYLTGQAAFRYLSVVPAAAVEAGRGRSQLRQRLLVAALTAGATVAVMRGGYSERWGSTMPHRIGISAVIVGTGIYVANRRQASAQPHFEEAVRLYNQVLQP